MLSSLIPASCHVATLHMKTFSHLFFGLTLTTYLTNSGNVGIRLALLIVLNLFLISLAISNLFGWMFWLLGSLANLSWNITPVTCHHSLSISCGHQVGWYESFEGISDHEECCPWPEEPESGLAEEGGEPGLQYECYVREWWWSDDPTWPPPPGDTRQYSGCSASAGAWPRYWRLSGHSAMNKSNVFINQINSHLEILAIHNSMLDIIP